jgi:hypothetical protein
MFEIKKLTEDIWFWENVFDNPKEIIDEVKNQNNLWNESLRQNGDLFGKEISINSDNFEKIYKKIKSAISICFLKYLDEKNYKRNDYYLIDSGFLIREQSGFFDGISDHTDIYFKDGFKGVQIIPEFTILCYFNDDFVGGELTLSDNDLIVTPKPGSIIILPKNTTHGVNNILSGSRYMTWTFAISKQDFNDYIII